MDFKEYFGIAWGTQKFLPSPTIFRSNLKYMGLLEDLLQSLRESAWESFTLSESVKPASNRAQRALYKFLKEYGWKRPRLSPGYVREFEFLELEEEEKERWE